MSTFGYNKASSGLQRSNEAWRGINVEAIQDDPAKGFYYRFNPLKGWTDLTSAGSNGEVTLVIATAGQLLILDGAEGGVVQVDCNSTTDNQGATMFFPGCVVIPKANRTIVFKGVVRAKDIATGPQFFFGVSLSTLDTTPITADAMAAGATDYVGVFSTGNTGTNNKLYFAAEKAGAQSISTKNVHTFLDGDTVTDGTEWVKFEVRINGLRSLELYVNGVKLDHDVAVASIPAVAMRLQVACLSATTTDPIIEVKDIEIASVPSAA